MNRTFPRSPRPTRHRRGFTLLELLVVIAIVGVVAGVGTINGRRIAERQTAGTAVSTLRQSVWQGATLAASRGREVELVHDAASDELLLRQGSEVLRSFEMPATADSNLPSGMVLRFLPPGKVDESTLDDLPGDLWIEANGTRHEVEISLIGEVRTETNP